MGLIDLWFGPATARSGAALIYERLHSAVLVLGVLGVCGCACVGWPS
jgi:hypothetical protein